MSMILRSWICLNKACGEWFDSYESNPECKKCGCVRVQWRPNGGHPSTVAPGADRTLRMLAADYGLTDLNSPSPSRVNRAMPVQKQPSPAGSIGIKHWAPGFSSEVYQTSHCTTSLNPPNLKGFQPVGKMFPQGTDMRYRGVTPQARHRPT